MIYAEILDGKVWRVYDAPERPLIASPFELVEVQANMGTPDLGASWDGASFFWPSPPPPPPPAPPKPELVITSLVVDAPGWAEGTSEATLKKGTTAKATGELRLSGVKIPFSATFRMPIQANDGRERLILATLTEGALSVEWTPTESGTWAVSQEAINRGLPPEDRMTFAGLRLLVLD